MPTSSPRQIFLAGLPRKVVAAGCLITDDFGRVLLVEPTYKTTWEMPGGVIEDGEAARTGAHRECQEELGLTIAVGRVLVIEHHTEPREEPDKVVFVFDGGRLHDLDDVRLREAELRSARFVDPADLNTLANARLSERFRAALDARRSGTLVEIVDGERVKVPGSQHVS